MVIEDNPADADLMIAALRRASPSIESEVVSTPEAFLYRLNSREFDVILSDHNLVTWTGQDALVLLHRSGKDTPFIVVTGSLGDELAVAYLKNGATDYVLKDHLHRLQSVVARALREKAQRDENSRLQEQRARIIRELHESEGRLRALVQSIPDLIWMKDASGVYLGCNSQFEQFTGLSASEIVGKADAEFMSAPISEVHAKSDQNALAAKEPSCSEEWMISAQDGRRALFEVIKARMTDETGRLLGTVGVARDITARFRSEQDLRIAACAFEAQEGILITDAQGRIVRVNSAFVEITGYSAEEAIGNTPRLLKSNRHDNSFYQKMWESIGERGSWHGEIWNRRKSGEIYPEWLTITAVKNKQGEVTHYVGMMLDITARHEASLEIERLAFFDQLTQLPNRRLLLDRLQQGLLNCRRYDHAGAVYFIDLDDFKLLNDSLGHDMGDALLVEVARRLSSCIRENDTVARFGGDEFVIVIEGLTKDHSGAVAQAKQIGEKALTALCRPYDLGGITHHASASIGLTLFDNSSSSVEEIMKQADIAMYQAKAAGRQTLRVFDPAMQANIGARALLEQDLRAGIERGEFLLFYQPQVDSGGRVIGAEALLRWQHPERGMILPEQFIGVAEETGLILPIGQWVLESACQQLSGWARMPRLGSLALSVNVSARQFRQEDFVSRIRRALTETGTSPDRLTLELTESALISDIATTSQKMNILKGVGVGVSIDDFGTGFSSLSYLTRFPLDQLKIDRSFIHKLPDNAADATVVQAILTLGNSLGLTVVAEGVETESQHMFLHNCGCPTFQGYLFGHPMDVNQFEECVNSTTTSSSLVH